MKPYWFVLLLPLTVHADWYSYTSMGQATIHIKQDVPPSWRTYGLFAQKDETAATKTFAAGYQVTDWLAVEGAYHDLGTYTACVKQTALGNLLCAHGTVTSYSMGVLVFAGPVYVRGDYHLVVAEAYLPNSQQHYEEDAVITGVGIRAPLGPRLFLRVEAHYPTVPRYEVGLEVRF